MNARKARAARAEYRRYRYGARIADKARALLNQRLNAILKESSHG